MAALTAKQVKDLITRTQDCYGVIQHEKWDANAGRTDPRPLPESDAIAGQHL